MDLTNLNRDRKNRRKSSMDLSTMVYGKVPPQAKELEEAILGAIMLQKDAFSLAIEELKNAEPFYIDAHRRIFSAMRMLSERSQPVDMFTVAEQLRTNEELDMIGGPYYLSKLTNVVVSSANIVAHCRIVYQKFIQREVIRISGEMISEAYEDSTDAFELLDKVEKAVYEVTANMQRREHQDLNKLMVDEYKELETKRHKKDAIDGVPSGFQAIDKLTNGWQRSDLIILAARPSVGKTALALNLARNAAKDPFRPRPTAFFSLEMSARQLVRRILSAETGVTLESINRGRLEESHMETIFRTGLQKLSSAPLYIDDTPALNIFELRAKSRRLKSIFGIELIIVDYLQLMSGVGDRRGNREQEISNISRGIKSLAKELDISIIALSQLSREAEKRENKMPQLSDLRESGAIEQDADVVCFIYRPEYHQIMKDGAGNSTVGETILRFAKHRNGSCENVKLKADLSIQKFTDMPENDRYVSNDYKARASNDVNLFIQPGTVVSIEDEDDPF